MWEYGLRTLNGLSFYCLSIVSFEYVYEVGKGIALTWCISPVVRCSNDILSPGIVVVINKMRNHIMEVAGLIEPGSVGVQVLNTTGPPKVWDPCLHTLGVAVVTSGRVVVKPMWVVRRMRGQRMEEKGR